MYTLHVTSWNMQGAFSDKLALMCPPASAYILSTNILFVQEAGNPDGKGIPVGARVQIFGKVFECIASEIDPYAKVNYRCTTSVLVDDFVLANMSAVEKIGLVGYRPIIGVRIGNRRILTIHDTADGQCGNIKQLIQSPEFNFHDQWMIMGDLNCTPNNMLRIQAYPPYQPLPINLGTQSRPKCMYAICPQGYTQGAAGSRTSCLDYILASEEMLPSLCSSGAAFIENVMVLDGSYHYLSDHNMISCQVYI